MLDTTLRSLWSRTLLFSRDSIDCPLHSAFQIDVGIDFDKPNVSFKTRL